MDVNPYEAPAGELLPEPQPIHSTVTMAWSIAAFFLLGVLGTGIIAVANLLAAAVLLGS